MKPNDLINVCIKGGKTTGYLVQNFDSLFTIKSRKVLVERIKTLQGMGLPPQHIDFVVTAYLKGFEEGINTIN